MRNLKSALIFSLKYNKKVAPNLSANSKTPFRFFGAIVLILCACAFYNINTFSYYFILNFQVILMYNFMIKFWFFGVYLFSKKEKTEIITPSQFPMYTILLPCYKEEIGTLKKLITGIKNLNYPKEKLDVKILLEETDLQTIENLQQISHTFEVLKIPNAFPTTKPKACNFGLYFAKGEYVVIYDAEDIPHPNQLLTALSKFSSASKNIMCVQSLLNVYNHSKNLISICFSLEYLVWFNCFLPAFLKCGMWIPLGGTSNHFKTKELLKIGGWDAYNVTEDAELGIRIAKNGYKTDIIYSYTLEESTITIKDFILQRSRWLKGFLITFLINILDFKSTLKLDFLNILQIIFSLGMAFFGFFSIPLIIFFSFFITPNELLISLYSTNLICGILYLMICYIVGLREKFTNYNKAFYFLPLYFALHICASIVAFWDFFKSPFHWRKTRHISS